MRAGFIVRAQRALRVGGRPLKLIVRHHGDSALLGILLLLLGVFVAIPVALFFLVRWIAFRTLRRNPNAAGMRAITPSGFFFYTCLVVALFSLFAVRELQPDGPLGAFLGRPLGYMAALFVVLVVSSTGEFLLRRLGVPTTRDGARRDV